MRTGTKTGKRPVFALWTLLLAIWLPMVASGAAPAPPIVTASSSAPDFPPDRALDGNRLGVTAGQAWKGAAGPDSWTWQVDFGRERRLGSWLQVLGDHDFVLRQAPRTYVWEGSRDGQRWEELPGTRVENERRLLRIHRLPAARRVRFLRLHITGVHGETPTLREVEFDADPRHRWEVPWVLAVNVTHDGSLPGHGQEFIPLARSSQPGLAAQQIWLTDFTPEFLAIEPRPLAAFLSGSFKDWCEVNREHWRGTQRVLEARAVPLWASCGGAQGLAILAETGVDQPWDCPHCRDPRQPRLPIYTHIGHTGTRPCGDYSACVFERGPHAIRPVKADPVFAGLGPEFSAMESHCGQIEWAPRGWELIATAGAGTATRTQCLKLRGFPIYAAQFHIEMAGTPETSRRIMANFLSEAGKWSPRRRSRR